MTTPTSVLYAYEAGREASLAGKGIGANPHLKPPGRPSVGPAGIRQETRRLLAAGAWDRGWADVCREQAEAKLQQIESRLRNSLDTTTAAE